MLRIGAGAVSPAPARAMIGRDRAEGNWMSWTSYEEMCAAHRWEVPPRYNIAADVCDKHPRDKLAMVWESFDGSGRELVWGELQDLANQAAHTLAAHGVERGDRVAVVLPPTPETAAIFFGVWKLGAILLSMSVLYGDDGIEHRLSDSGARLLVTDAANAPRFDRPWAPEVLVLDGRHARRGADRPRLRRHLGRRPGAALLHVGHDGPREGHRARAPLRPRPRGVRLLPRGARTASASTAWASGRGRPGSRRCSARGGSARCSASTGARAASTRTSSSTSSAATA